MTPNFKGFTPLPSESNLTIDQAYEWHSIHSASAPVFVYPEDDDRLHYISWKDMGKAINTGVNYIKEQTPHIIPENHQMDGEPLIVGVLSTADPLTFTTFLLSCIRLTHLSSAPRILPFAISPRNSATAVAHLLKLKQVKHVWVTDGPMRHLFDEAMKYFEPEQVPIRFVFPTYQELYYHDTSFDSERQGILLPVPLDRPAIILHSSGSTAFPKPITLTHQMLVEWGMKAIQGDLNFKGQTIAAHNVLMFHSMGWFITGWAVYTNFIRAIQNPFSTTLLSDPKSFLREMVRSKSTMGYTLPSVLEIWANEPENVEILKNFKTIFWGGGPLNERTSQYLRSQGVGLTMVYGSTETGCTTYLADKNYPEGYEWFRLPSCTDPVFIPDHEEPDLFEVVFKLAKGHHIAVFNTEIDGVPAYTTSDLLERHPNNHNLYRVRGRVDDQIILSTGEKTNPIPIESIISKNPHVKSAVVFGRGRTSNGVVIEPTSFDEAERLGLEKFRSLIWPSVENANEYAPSHSRIFKEMIILASQSKPFVYTAKNTARRGAVIKDYDNEIEQLYKAVENSAQTDIPLPSELDELDGWSFEATRNFVGEVVHSIMKDAQGMKDEDDFFAHGCDSLQATYIRNTMLHALREGSSSSNVHNLPNNLVYQHPTINALAEIVSQSSRPKAVTGKLELNTARQKRLQEFIKKYTQNWPKHEPGSDQGPYPEVILLTGSTGGLGSQILAELVNARSITRIYAFNRPSTKTSRQRHTETFADRGNDMSVLDSNKVVYVEGDTSAENLGIDPELFKQLRDSVTTIIHTAWRVDFNISLISFEQTVRGVRNLIDLALASPHTTPPRLLFTSSIGNVKLWANISAVTEGPLKNVDLVSSTGYNESKWISEQILETASVETPLKPIIVRVGQLCGGINGNWNTREWFPALVKVSKILKALPENDGLVSFIPLHLAARSLVELRHSSSMYSNLVHPCPVAWNDVIRWISERSNIPMVPYSEWLRRLEGLPRTLETLSHNPALHLLDFYRAAAIPANVLQDLQHREAMGIATYETMNTISNAPSLHPDRLPQLTRDDINPISRLDCRPWEFKVARLRVQQRYKDDSQHASPLMENLRPILFGNEFVLSVIGVPPPFESLIFFDDSRPFKPVLPVELIHYIIYLTALHFKRCGKPQYELLAISKSTRNLVYPVFFETLELFGIERMISFVETFVPESFLDKRHSPSLHLITSTVKRIALIDKAPGNVQLSGLIIPTNLLDIILSFCSSVQTLYLNYIHPIPEIGSFRPTELTVRRGLRYIDLHLPPFRNVRKLHCRYEQVFPLLVLTPNAKLCSSVLTHLCFTQHLNFAPDHICVEIVQGCIGQRPSNASSTLGETRRNIQANASDARAGFCPLPNLVVLIIEMSFERRHIHNNPPLRTTLANISDPQNRLFVRVSPYNTVLPVDGMEVGSNAAVSSGSSPSPFTRDVWDTTDCLDWRTRDWDETYIKERMGDAL